MDIVMQILSQPFTWGLVLGLFMMSVVWKLMRKDIVILRHEKKRLEEESRELQKHLNTQLKINAKGNEQLQAQLDELREQNETLRSNLSIAKQKPGRAELRHLQCMEAAVSAMREQAPGFAPAWEKALRDAEATEEAAGGGFKKLMRKVIPNNLTSSKSTPMLTTEAESDSESDSHSDSHSDSDKVSESDK